MSILPINNQDPSQDYVLPGAMPPLTHNGLVYNRYYAHTGVIDTLSQSTQRTGYTDPNTNIINGSNNGIAFKPVLYNPWISSPQLGGTGSAPVVLTYNLSNVTYFNDIRFYVLNVPCYVELLDGGLNALPGQSTFIVNGGSDINTKTDWYPLEYTSPSTLSAPSSISLRITRNKSVQTTSATPANIAYSVGVSSFSVQLKVLQKSDVPTGVIAGVSGIIAQNRLGFIENHSFVSNAVSNAFTASGTYWKSAPQPVADSVVYFYAQVGASGQTSTINRLYIDPLYSSCKFNLYFSTSSGTNPDNFTWTPVQRDFTLRKGVYELPTINCSYLKFEFVKLMPEVYDIPFDSVQRTVNVFPYDVESFYTNLEQNIIDGNATQYSNIGNNNNGGNTSNNNISSSTLFGYATNSISNNYAWPSLGSLATSQYGNNVTEGLNTSSFVSDPSVSYKLIDTNGNYNGQSYTDFLQRRFTDTRQHNYTQLTINHNWHQAYFTGVYSVAAFYETTYDELRATPSNITSHLGFKSSDINYVMMSLDDYATTPWFNTIDQFSSFNIGALTTDWNSFLTDQQVLMNDSSVLSSNNYSQCSGNPIGSLGSSRIISISPLASGASYYVRSNGYTTPSNILNYDEANFNSISNWYSSTSTLSSGVFPWNSGTQSGTSNGLSVSGGSYTASYNFTIPNVWNASGIQPFSLELGGSPFGSITFGGNYVQASGTYFEGFFQYYFLVNALVSGINTVSCYTQFVNPSGNTAIANTLVSGNTLTTTGTGTNFVTLTGTHTMNNVPSNTIQFTISGSSSYNLIQLGAFNNPQSVWVSPQDRKNMRIGGAARMYLPSSNNGSYRISIFGKDITTGSVVEITYKQYNPNTLPISTWFDLELEGFTGSNYTDFNARITQTNSAVNETFYLSMLSAFYNPVRFEYTTYSGSSNWWPITTGINDPSQFISTVSGVAASGIQLKMTALDDGVFISGVSVVPYYKQSPYYAELDIDYIGSSKTNELSSRRRVASKPLFQLNKNFYPSKFSIKQVAPNVQGYVID